MKLKNLLLATVAVAAIACKKDKPISTKPAEGWNGKIADMPVPDGFDYSTIAQMKTSIRVNDLEDAPLRGVMVNFYTQDPTEGGQFLGRSLTNFSGVAESVIRLPKFLNEIFVEAANPWSACDVQNTPPVIISSDADNDGVPDDVDEFPSDPTKAYTCNFTGTLAYEDLWPSQGDYDFNDLVLDYDITHASNANNNVVDMQTDWTVRAVGAAFKNGFGWQFENLVPSDISSVSGQDLQEGIISNSANGTEQNQQKATVIAFDNVFNVMPNPGTPFINTVKGQVVAPPQTLSLNVVFTIPQVPAQLGLPPYNPFIFINKDRTKEVHLADRAPTDLANMSLLGSNQDDSQPGTGKYYKTKNNLPWALSIESSFDYPVEFSPVTDGYQNFAPWAISAGLQFQDWYLDLAGNRNATYIY